MRGKDALKNTIFELLNQLFIIIRALIIPKLIISIYGSDVNGLICSIANFLEYIILLDAGFSLVVRHHLYEPIAKNDKARIESILLSTTKFFKKIAIIFVFYVLGLLILYPIIINEFEWKFIDILIVIISLSTFFEYYIGITNSVYIKSLGKSYIVSITNMLLNIISSIVVIILVKNNSDIILVRLISSIAFVIKPLFFSYYVRKKCQINLRNAKENYIFNNKWERFSQNVAWIIFKNTDVVILSLLSTLVNVSIYSIYASICMCLRSLCNAITNGIDATFGSIIARGEKKVLNERFNMYEILYFTIVAIVFSCALQIIMPFIRVYTLGISDANYINPTLGILIVLSEYVLALRLPYKALINSIGHFKETRTGAWIECILNIVLSVVLVIKYGLIGVVVGTFISSFVRTIEFICYVNKNILNRQILMSIKKIIILILETVIIYFSLNYIPMAIDINYVSVIKYSVVACVISTALVFIINTIFYKSAFKNAIIYVKNVILRLAKRRDYEGNDRIKK